MTKEQDFWNRILEFAQERLTRSMYDFYATPAELIKVEENTATIFLPRSEMEMVWEKQLKDIIVAAGFEIYDSEIKPHYIFTKPQSTESPQVNDTNSVSTYDYTPALPTIPYSETGLKEKYTFDNFIQGDGNVWAVSAALAVSEDLALTYNPLFIYGGPLEHLRLGEMEKFKKTYRSLDLLLIDDIQSLSGKKVATQEEFFNTFNALHDKQKQIVLTSDRSPKHLEGLEERLVTRFSWGLTQNITPPDFETRIAILQSKTEHLDYHFQSDTLEYLAGQFDSNVRELEGAINDITLIARVKKIKDITIDIAAEAIRARKQDARQILVIPIEKIQTEVGNFYGVSVKEMKGTRRVQNIVLARQVAMYLARELTDNSLPKIGKEFGGKDHTTVIHAHAKIKSLIDEDDNLRLEIEAIKKKIK